MDGKFDAIILAQAGISRLGSDVKHSALSTKDFPPSPGQGALAIICRADDDKTISMLKKLKTKNLEQRLKLKEKYQNTLNQVVDFLSVHWQLLTQTC